MTRAREASEAGIYHTMYHAIEDRSLFYDERDCKRFLALIRKHAKEHGAEILAWCLMGNHVHLLLRASSLEILSGFMRDVASGYARYFNKRYKRNGHLQHQRFNSKAVNDDPYLLTVVRYIHQNPIAAHLTSTCDYRWSSYQEYVGKYQPCIISPEFVLELFGGVEAFIAFHDQQGEPDGSLDPIDPPRPTDEEATAIIRDLLDARGISNLKAVSKSDRDEVIRSLREMGLKVRQIASITGVSQGTVASA